MPDAQEAFQAIIKAMAVSGNEPIKAARRVACISRDYGAVDDDVARRLASRLGVEVFDHVVLDKITSRLDTDKETLGAVESGASRVRDLWLYSLVTGKDLSADRYRQHLINVVLSIGRSGGVILGRGAHLILARSGALRVRFTGSPTICARRIAAAEGIGLEAARTRVEEANTQRALFIQDTFNQRLDDVQSFDLVINTDHIADNNKVVDMLVDAVNMVGPPREEAVGRV